MNDTNVLVYYFFQVIIKNDMHDYFKQFLTSFFNH